MPYGATAIAGCWPASSMRLSGRSCPIRRPSRVDRHFPRWPRPPGAVSRNRRGLSGRRTPTRSFTNYASVPSVPRYTAELIAPIMGRRAARAASVFIRLLTQVQDTLGEHQDAVIAAHEIEHALAAHGDDPPFNRAAKSLIDLERENARIARESFFKQWERLDRRKTRRWMKISPKVKAGA